jgi:hypothetical protein
MRQPNHHQLPSFQFQFQFSDLRRSDAVLAVPEKYQNPKEHFLNVLFENKEDRLG